MNWAYKIVIDGVEYRSSESEIWSLSLENSLMEKQFEIGNCFSGTLNATVSLKGQDIPRMASVQLFVQELSLPPVPLIWNDAETWNDADVWRDRTKSTRWYDTDVWDDNRIWNDGADWIARGQYFIATREVDLDKRRLTIECFDIMRSFDTMFLVYGLQPDWPMPMLTVLGYIVTGTGIQVEADSLALILASNYVMDYPNERTIREVLQDIASAYGGNWIITWKGTLKLVAAYSSRTSHDVQLSITNFSAKPDAKAISRVTLWQDSEKFYTAGDDTGLELQVDNVNATQPMVNNLLQKFKGFVNRPFTATKTYLDPVFDLGDSLIVSGVAYTINSFQMTASSTIVHDLSNPVEDETDDEFEFQGEMSRAFQRTIQEGSQYYGVSITRKKGLQIEREDGVSSTTINSDVWEVMFEGIKRLYFDMTKGEFVFNGKLSTSVQVEQGQVTGLTLDLNQIRVNADNTDGNVAALEFSVDGVKTSVNALDGRTSSLEVSVDGIQSEVSEVVELLDPDTGQFATKTYVSSAIDVSATNITQRVTATASIPIVVSNPSQMTNQNAMYKYNGRYWIWDSNVNQWISSLTSNFGTVFRQSAGSFYLDGAVIIEGNISANNISAGSLNTDYIDISSWNGQLSLSGNRFQIRDTNGREQITISPSVGYKHVLNRDSQGRETRSAVINTVGAGTLYTEYDDYGISPTFARYADLVVTETVISSAQATHYYVHLNGPGWTDTNRWPSVIVSPAEMIRFTTATSGNIGDVSRYVCTYRGYTRTSQGITLEIESWKYYVDGIQAGQPVWRTQILNFNLLCILN